MDFSNLSSTDWTPIIMDFGIKLISALVVLVIGLWVIGLIGKTISKVFEKRNIDPSLRSFLKTLVTAILKVLLVISIIDMIGIEVTSFIAILGAAGLAVGMALSGTLQNFAGGVIILILKPYKVGDVIEAQGFIASVSEIQIFHTIMKTWDNKTIIIPNAQLSNSSLVNYSTEELRKVEWVFGIGYGDDIDKAKKIIEETIFSDERIIDKDNYFINVSALADSSVNIKVRAQLKSADYWDVFFQKTEAIKKAFDEQGVNIPFPQRDVHLYQASK